MKKLEKQVYNLIALIPKGRVTTYGQIAKVLKIKSPRLIGKILHQNKDPQKIPCHRVIFATGRLAKNYAFGGLKKQKKRLLKEGVNIINNKVELKKYLFRFKIS